MLRRIWPFSKLYGLSKRVYDLQEQLERYGEYQQQEVEDFRRFIAQYDTDKRKIEGHFEEEWAKVSLNYEKQKQELDILGQELSELSVSYEKRLDDFQTNLRKELSCLEGRLVDFQKNYQQDKEEIRQDTWFTKYGYDWLISDLQMTCVEAAFPGNREKLLALKDTHVGESCFVIGNGPSLKAEDLDKLKENNIFCFASKGIYYIFDQTEWRPDVWGASDLDYIRQSKNEIEQLTGFPKLICAPSYIKDGVKIENAIYYPFIQMERRPPWFNLDVTRGVHFWGTITCKLINFAAYMGFKKIYLLGVDNTYGVVKDKNGRYMYDVNAHNHFTDKYLSAEVKKNLEKDINNMIEAIEYVNLSYQSIKWHCEQIGVEIYNATRGGELETYPRVELEKVLNRER